MPWTNYHSHTHYCDGTNPAEDYVHAALEQGIVAYGYSSHCPIPFPNEWSMRKDRLDEYVSEIRALQAKWADTIQLYCGLEVDYVPNMMGPNHPWIQEAGLDYTIGSVHYVDAFPNGKPWEIDGPHTLFLQGLAQVFDGDIEVAVTRYYELTRQMIEEDCPDVVGHLDKIKMQNSRSRLFVEGEKWYKDAMMETLELIAQAGVIVEINTRGIYKKRTSDVYPSAWVLREILRMNIPIMLNSDSHHPTEITKGFVEASELLAQIGFKELWVLMNGEWQPFGFSPKGVEIPSHAIQ